MDAYGRSEGGPKFTGHQLRPDDPLFTASLGENSLHQDCALSAPGTMPTTSQSVVTNSPDAPDWHHVVSFSDAGAKEVSAFMANGGTRQEIVDRIGKD